MQSKSRDLVCQMDSEQNQLLMERFNNYDFEKDDNFMKGWKSISSNTAPEDLEKEMRKAKQFYFTKNFEELLKDKGWMEVKEVHMKSSTADGVTNHGIQQPVESNTESCNLSFGEIKRLVQSGETIPGIKQVNVQPTNSDPSPSRLPVQSKPWQ